MDKFSSRRSARLPLVGVLFLTLSACGGGGGGGGGSGGGSGNSGSLTLSRTTLDFTTNNPAQTPPSQIVGATINTTASGTVFLRVVTQGPAVANVTNIAVTSDTSGQATIVPASASTLGPGQHSATITVTACTTDISCTSGLIGSPQTIQVNYVVSGATSATAALSYRAPLNSVAADYTRSFSITTHPTYTITTTQPWLTVTPASGTSGTVTLTANLTAATVDALPSGDHTAEITVTTPGNTLRIPVTVTNAKPQLDQVTPYVALPNVSDTVVMRGQFLDQLSASSIDFLPTAGGAAISPTSVQIISATELRVTHPALASGAYPVRMRNAQGVVIDRSSARLFVADTPAYTSQTIPYPDANRRRVNGLVYDAERRMLVLSTNLIVNNAIDFANNELLRYSYTTAWGGAAPGGLRPQIDQLVLSADGRVLVDSVIPNSSSDIGRIEQLTLNGTPTGAQASARSGGFTFSSLAATSTGAILAMEGSNLNSGQGFRLFLYQPGSNALQELAITPFSDLSQSATVATSGDGLRGVVFGNSNNQSSVYDFNSATGALTRSTLSSAARSISLDRAGNRVAASSAGETVRIYDRSWTLLGTLPASTRAFVLSPRGDRAIAFDVDGKVRVFDITANVAGGAYAAIGNAITPAGDPGTIAEPIRLALTPDARTLFVAGDTRIAVVPLP